MRREELHAFLAVPERPGPGIPLAVKDIFDTAGLATTCGSAVFRERVPEQTAEAVTRLEDAGYAVVGKTNMHEFAYGISSENEHYGNVVNPLDASRIPGGSSGGSAVALAAGLADACARHRLGRLDPNPGRVLWDRRLQADPRPHPDGRRLPAGAELRPCGADGAVD